MLRTVAAIVALCAAGLVILDARHWRTGDPRHASFRTIVISVLILLGLSVACQARPSPYPPVTPFEGDRYVSAQLGPEVTREAQRQRAAKKIKRRVDFRDHQVGRKNRHKTPVPRPRLRQVPIFAPYVGPGTVEPLAVPEPLSVAGGAWREAKRAVGRPRAWCGWWLGQHLGMPLRELWLARNWARVGSSTGGPRVGAIVVWRHHVGIITGRQNGWWVVKSGNDGGAVRERPRSVAGAIAFRSPSS